ncbi:MAG: PAS domain S-box protein [Planctomycetes bacterium]|nr:PAS domain S-box protein [Planctomycetota bacterium]
MNSLRWISAAAFVVLLGLLLPAAGSVVLASGFPDVRWEQPPFHAVLEGLGAFTALALALVFLALRKYQVDSPHQFSIAHALIAMAVLDGLHAAVASRELFVWFRSLSTLAGGFLFLGVWLPDGVIRSVGGRWAVRSATLGVVASCVLSAVPASDSLILNREGSFTLLAKAVNLVGGLFFLLAAVRLLLRYRWRPTTDEFLFAMLCALFGSAGVLFGLSRLWDPAWWWWHLLRVMAYVLALRFVLSTFRDTLRELRESEAWNRCLMDSAPEPIIVVDAGGRILAANARVQMKLGYSLGEVRHRPVEMLGPELARAFRAPGHGDVAVRRKDGGEYPAEVALSPMTTSHGPATIGIIRDVTERRDLEDHARRVQKMEAVGRLASGVAHDFRNLMMVIGSYSEVMLRRVPADDPMRAHLEKIQKAKERAADLTTQLLAFSRGEAVPPRLLDVGRVIAEMKEVLKQVVGRDIDLTLSLGSGLDMTKVDPAGLEQVIMNLVMNARDAMAGGGKIEIVTRNVILDEEYARAHPEVRPGEYVMLAVSDTGCGMKRETLSRIFEPFFTTKEKGKGTGLGLFLVYGIVRQSEGHIDVYSEPGRGTTFRIYLPRAAEGSSLPVPVA